MRCVQRRACPRPLHLNLFPTSTPPLINYDQPEDRGDLWTVKVIAYAYTLLDADKREVLNYHWHPIGSSHVTTSHLPMVSMDISEKQLP